MARVKGFPRKKKPGLGWSPLNDVDLRRLTWLAEFGAPHLPHQYRDFPRDVLHYGFISFAQRNLLRYLYETAMERERLFGSEYWSKHGQEPKAPSTSEATGWRRVLEVSYEATVADVKSSYRRLALKHHPDRGGDTDAMTLVNLAMEQARRELRF